MRQTSKNVKLRSNSVNCLLHSLQHERKMRVETTLDQDKPFSKHHQNHIVKLAIFNQRLAIKKDLFSIPSTLTVIYEINSQHNSPIPAQTITDEIAHSKKLQKLTLHIKKMDMIIIRNETKHFHAITPQSIAKDFVVIDLQVPNTIISVNIENDQSSKKVDIDLTKIPPISQSGNDSFCIINPIQFIEEGIKLRASKMQSTGKRKKIVWGNDSSNKLNSANIHNSQPELIPLSQVIVKIDQNKQLTPFNDNFQSFCSKKLDFANQSENYKEGIFGQLQKKMGNEMIKKIGQKLVTEEKQLLREKLNDTKNKMYQFASNKRKSQPDCTLKEKNLALQAKKTNQQIKRLGQTQQMNRKVHSRQNSGHSQQNLENFFNIDTQKAKEKKKAISYKTDMNNLCAFSKSINVVDPVQKTKKNKENDLINQKTLALKKGIINSKKMVPSSSFVGTAMVKSIRMKTEAN